MQCCYFCKEPLHQNNRPIDRHHRLAKRFFKRGDDHRTGNIVMVHSECHVRFNRQYDKPHMPLQDFIPYMDSLRWGEGIYSASTAD